MFFVRHGRALEDDASLIGEVMALAGCQSRKILIHDGRDEMSHRVKLGILQALLDVNFLQKQIAHMLACMVFVQ